MSDIMQIILDKIKEYEKIILFRHIRPDGDAIGSAKGFCEMIRLSFPEKKVYLGSEDASEQLAFLGGEDLPIDEGEYKSSLGIVLDCATSERISSKKYKLCRELIKIDHHIPVESYADIEWVEPHRSSTCEMICAFYDAFKGGELKMNLSAATYLYCGMVTDSGRFRFNSTSGESLRLAGLLLDFGIDTEPLYTRLYLKEPRALRLDAYVLKNMKITENGVASIFISKRTKERLGLTREEAGDAVLVMDSIKGSLIWIAFIEADGEIRARLRSRFVAINKLAEKYSGGGHAHACGATVYSKREMKALMEDADRLLSEYKLNNPDIL